MILLDGRSNSVIRQLSFLTLILQLVIFRLFFILMVMYSLEQRNNEFFL